ncbi:MAG: AAA family ATPase [Tannerella sp.]|jgi:predicted ATPase|nr:AAA family ATPase [Tannerella sp.]
MLTRLEIRNFKKLEDIAFSLSSSVAIIGPNNSGKSTIFQALCLWEIGLRNYLAAKAKDDLKGDYVTINRKDLLNSPISDARFLWKKRKVTQYNKGKGTRHIPISIRLQGEQEGITWECQVEFIFSNAESFSCKVISGAEQMAKLYEQGTGIHFGFLQAMSGISTSEDKLTQGSIDRKLGEGKTAEVLRNICFEILYPEIESKADGQGEKNWNRLCEIIKRMFGAQLEQPEYNKTTGLVSLEYTEDGIKYDISSAGRGFQQTLLLFAYMYAHQGTVFLLDEPDAHLEVIRQREAFHQINEVAIETNTQVLIASHSEVVLNEAAASSEVVALIANNALELNIKTNGKSIGYLRKALTDIGWEKYYLAKSKGHVLYMEGSTDLQMLLAFANKLKHKAEPLLRSANVCYTSNNLPADAIANYVALKEFIPLLKGMALFDRIDKEVGHAPLKVLCWQRRELENYFARPELLLKHAGLLSYKYSRYTADELRDKMQEAIELYTLPIYLKNGNDPWWNDGKLSDDWLDKIFPEFYKALGIPAGKNFKKNYYQLISLMDADEIAPEVQEKLDSIYELLK